jgi:hypothetical protein
VTLGRFVVAWVFVAIWFCVATFVSTDVVTRLAVPVAGTPYTGVPASLLKWRLIEAGLITLIGSLWFDSLGSGGWWLLFLLIGGLVGFRLWFDGGPREVPSRALVAESLADVARYVIAGALLAWRLS